jgi:tetratricopeptide (TPR) repeat protein
MKKALIIFFCVIAFSHAFSQSNKDEQLAAQYMQNADYEKAADIYGKLYDKQPAFYYTQYLRCLMAIKDFSKAERIVKKQIKKNESVLYLYVDLANVYLGEDKPEKAKQEYEKAIKQVSFDQQQVTMLANAFIERNEIDYAIQTYVKAKKVLKGFNGYNFELAGLYARKQDIGNMLEEYIDVLLQDENYLQQVQNLLQTNLAEDPNDTKKDYVKGILLKRIQVYPDKLIFPELLIWLFIQQKDFDSAFTQERALDKRFKEDGYRLMYLADLSLSNKNYNAAIKSYQYVIDKGATSNNYIEARIGILKARNKQLADNVLFSKEGALALEKDYNTAIAELGETAVTVQLIRDLAHLKAFYLHKETEATALLEEIININGIAPRFQAECKLELGDILLSQGEIWDATLLYGQVDKAFKQDPLGEEAKLRNARLSYYNGEFLFARSQLDVLAAGTSHLIANDAMALSLLISDNISLEDSNTTPLLIYSRAELLFYQNKYDIALATLDTILTTFPTHSLVDEVYFKKAAIMEKQGKYEAALEFLDIVVKKYGEDILADDALFEMASIYELKLNNKDKAKELYQQLMTKYQASLYVAEARRRFRLLRGDNIN